MTRESYNYNEDCAYADGFPVLAQVLTTWSCSGLLLAQAATCFCSRCTNLSGNFHSLHPPRCEVFFIVQTLIALVSVCSEVGQCGTTSRDPEGHTCWEQTCTSHRVRHCSAHPSASGQQTAQKPDQEALAELPDSTQGPGIDASGVARHHETQVTDRSEVFLISNFRRVLYFVCFLLGNSSASEFDMSTFRNILFHLYRQVGE